MVKWIVIFSSLLYFSQVEAQSKLIVFNRAVELVRGDYSDILSESSLYELFKTQGEDKQLIGLGTTTQFPENGEIAITGLSSDPDIIWTKGKNGRRGERSELSFPFLLVAIVDEEDHETISIEGENALYRNIDSILEARSDTAAIAIRLEGQMQAVEFSVVHHLTATGITVGDRSQDFFWRLNSGREPHQWQVVGIYTLDEELASYFSGDSGRLHLHGYSETLNQGGHLVEAKAYNLEMAAYPIQMEDILLINQPKRN